MFRRGHLALLWALIHLGLLNWNDGLKAMVPTHRKLSFFEQKNFINMSHITKDFEQKNFINMSHLIKNPLKKYEE